MKIIKNDKQILKVNKKDYLLSNKNKKNLKTNIKKN